MTVDRSGRRSLQTRNGVVLFQDTTFLSRNPTETVLIRALFARNRFTPQAPEVVHRSEAEEVATIGNWLLPSAHNAILVRWKLGIEDLARLDQTPFHI